MEDNPYLQEIKAKQVAPEEQKSSKKFGNGKMLKGGVKWVKKHGSELIHKSKDEKQVHKEYQFD